MYYRLKEPWAFRGWKKLPFAVCALAGEKKHAEPFLMEKEPFLELLYCNGEENVDSADFGEKGQRLLQELINADIIEVSDRPMPPLSSFQRYHVYPARLVKSVHWSITGKCNFRCRHCLVSAPDACHPQLALADCLHIVDEIAKCGIRRVDITGGEPLVRKDFEEIVKALSERNIDIGVLFTNASLLTKDTLDMLLCHHQHPTFQLSFDGLHHHDWLRGVPGAEEQTDAAFRLLKQYGFPVSVAMCIHRENRDSLRDTALYLADLGVINLRVNAPQNLGVWKQYSAEYALTEEEVWAVYRDFIDHYFQDGMPISVELDGYFRCKKGSADYKISYVRHAEENADWSRYPYCESVRHNIYIGPDGRLAPCMGFSNTALKDRFPSVLERPLGELTLEGYYHDVVETRISDYLKKNPECRSCEHLPVCCGGCMIEGITEDGDYLVPDGRACHFHKRGGADAVRQIADKAIQTYCGEKREAPIA